MNNARNTVLSLNLSILLFLTQALSYAETVEKKAQVYLKNGDKVSGEVIFDDKEQVKIKNDLIGTVAIRKDGVEKIVYADQEKAEFPAQEKKKTGPWSGDFSFGYDELGGNTRESSLSLRLLLNRKTEKDEFTAKGEMYYSSANDKMDAQKWYNMFRYAYSLRNRRWYNYYKIENDHDRFANVTYRVLPSLGIGYWFFDSDALKLLFELGVGWEHTEYYGAFKDRNEAVLLPRMFFEKSILAKLRFSQELAMYPSLTEEGEYRLHSETAFINPINDSLALRLSFIDDYDSEPTGDAKRNDYRFICALSYYFK